MITIILPSVWTQGGRTEFEGREGSLPEVLQRFVAVHPEFERRLLDADGQPLRYLNICVDDDLVPRQRRAGTVVEAGRTVTVIAPMAGG